MIIEKTENGKIIKISMKQFLLETEKYTQAGIKPTITIHK